MNINSLKGILGDAVSNEVRTLELRVGQVVRGVVLQQHPNNEATVSINGVQVRAKLEIPLMEGQASLLQVQPDSKSGQIHLKQVDPTSMGLQDPMKDILKSLNLPDRQWAQELIKDLRKEGFALNKETAAAFQRAAQLMPAGVSQEQWMNAAAAVFKRGLPMSESTISAMHQLQNGTPLHQLLTQLRGELSQLIQNNSNPQLQQLLTQLSSQLEQGGNLLRQLIAGAAPSNSSQQTQAQQGVENQSNMPSTATSGSATAATSTSQATTNGGAAASQGAVNQQGSSTASMQNSLPTQQAAAPLAASVLGANGAANEQQLLPQLMKWLGVSHESQLVKSFLNQAGSNAATGNSNAPLPVSQQATANMANAASQQGQGNNVNGGLAGQAAQNATGAVSTSTPAAQSSTANASIQQSLTGGTATNTPQISSAVGSQVSAQAAGSGTPAPTSGNMSAVQQIASMSMQGDGAASTNSGATATTAVATTAQATNAQAATTQASNTALANVMPNQAAATQATSAAQAQSQAQTAPQINAQVQGGQMTGLPPMSPDLANAHGTHGQGSNAMSQDSLKATIMQLLQASDVPSGLKDAAQQVLHAITGQQLMMAAERNHSVFSHVTLYIPIQDGENGQTASIHVQTRRNRKGELDSDNCRIVFDLQMKNIGPTLVDMNVVNKIVTLNLWNDHPAISPIMDTLKSDIQDALQGYGYQLSSIRTTPIPIKDQEEVKKTEEGKTVIVPPDIDQLNSTRYKGVDFKI